MTHRDWLLKELEVWREEGLVSAETREKLIARYAKEPTRLAWGAVIAGSFGALLIGCGVIALFAVNWPQFGHETRAVLSALPILLCGLAAMFGAHRDVRTAAFWEPLGIVWCIATIAGASLIAQTYQPSGTVPALILFVLLLMLPVSWVTRSVIATSILPIFPIFWMCALTEGRWHHEPVIALEGFSLMALAIPGYVAFLRRKPGRAALVTGQLLTGLIFVIGGPIAWGNCMGWSYSYSYEMVVLTFWVFGALPLLVGILAKLPVWPIIGILVISIAAMTTPFDNHFLILYLVSLVFATATIICGVKRQRLAYANIGALTLGWLVLAKFFMYQAPFLTKGLVLIAAGMILTVMNVLMVRQRKNREVKA